MFPVSLLHRYAKDRSPVRAGLIGAGHFGTAVLAQARVSPLAEMRVVADSRVEAAIDACRQAGAPAEAICVCRSAGQAADALAAGRYAVVVDAMILMDLPLDVIVESTGSAEAGARHAAAAIARGKHVAMVNKETDSVVGPMLKVLADEAGVVYSPVDGDQHGLLIALVHWARMLGLEVLCGGKARDAEFTYDGETHTVSCGRCSVKATPEDVACLLPYAGAADAERLSRRAELLSPLPQAGGYDLCELAIAANATGLMPDTPATHCAALRTVEIPAVLCPSSQGGILSGSGRIDAVTCLRNHAEAGLGGGVFVVVGCDNDYSRMILSTKGCLANADGSAMLVFRPYHLCGVETLTTILSAGLLGVGMLSAPVVPRVDLVALAAKPLKAGAAVGNDHSADLRFELLPARPLAASNPAPLHLIAGRPLRRDVPAGTMLTVDMVVEPADSPLWQLRRRQDERFHKREAEQD